MKHSDDQGIVKQALVKIGELRERIAELEHGVFDPVAIIGAGCRLPGGIGDVDALWRLLDAGRDTVSEVPLSRWDAQALYDEKVGAPGCVYTRHGSFVDDIEKFDAAFFQISGREAEQMDPQQRLLLEVVWEALENAGIDPRSLSGTNTGVFVGLMNQDYADLTTGTGTAASVASGRISYVLGLTGPTLTIDTACSSSLVALHLACKSLARGECATAIVAGVNLQVTPKMTIVECAGHMLAADGHCKTFDERADGFGRSDGCVALVLRRSIVARSASDRVMAVIRGSAMNHDGATSGLTVPNGTAQAAVIRAALADARLAAHDVQCVEAHGTGTSLGDPIELAALASAYERDHAEAPPLYVGSVKTNFGHAEAAAGALGVLKIALALSHGKIPAHLHCLRRTSHFDWDGNALRIPDASMPWPGDAGARRAGVSAFGVSGTNAHLILEEAPTASPATEPATPVILKISARTDTALRHLATAHADFLRDSPASAGSVMRALNVGRADFDQRLAVVGSDLAGAVAMLDAWLAQRQSPDWVAGTCAAAPARMAWLFTGQGSHYPGMGQQLHRAEPEFRRAIEECASAIDPYLDVPLLDVMWGTNSQLLARSRYTQPALFAVEVALGQLWRSWGLHGDIFLGHSIGEYAAAHLAGVFDLADAAKLICARGRLTEELCAGGAMVAVVATEEQLRADALPRDTAIAAFNGDTSLVVSGREPGIAALCARWERAGVRHQRLEVAHGFHSPSMEPLLAPFGEVAATITYRKPDRPIVSTVRGRIVGDEIADARYWVDHVRQPVRFADGVRLLIDNGVALAAEIGPKPILGPMAERCAKGRLRAVGSLWPGENEALQMRRAAAALYCQGAALAWETFQPGQDIPASLPTYRFQRQRYWLPEAEPGRNPVSPAPAASGYMERWVETPASVDSPKDDRPLLVPLHGGLVDEGIRLHPMPARVLEAPADVATLRAALQDAGAGTLDAAPLTVLALATESSSSGAAPDALALRWLAVMQAARGLNVRVWLATADSLELEAGALPPALALLAGMSRAAHAELGSLWGGHVHVRGPDATHSLIERALAETCRGDHEDVSVYLQGRRFVPRIVPCPAAAANIPMTLAPAATYLIAGGLGHVGLALAAHLAVCGARHLLMTTRNAAASGSSAAAEAVAALRDAGVQVMVVTADPADVTGFERAIVAAQRELPPVRGVIHALGADGHAALADMTERHWRAAVDCKVNAALALERIFGAAPLDFFVMISSVAAVWGGAGNIAYAAANACLDAVVDRMRPRQPGARSIRFGPWSGGLVDAERQTWLESTGLRALTLAEAVAGFERAVTSTDAKPIVCKLDAKRLARLMELRRPRPMFRVLDPLPAVEPRATARSSNATRRDAALRVAQTLREVLRISPELPIEEDAPIQSFGVDSLLAIELRDRFAQLCGTDLPATLVFDHPTPRALARALFPDAREAEPAERVITRGSMPFEPVAIIGAGCRFPGGAQNLQDFWRLLREGRCAVADAPARLSPARWLHPDPEQQGKAYVMSAALLDNVEDFAASFFGIAAREAQCMDPQQRLVLETSWEAVESAGYSLQSEALRRTGVFVGVGANEYGELLMRDPESAELLGHVPTGNALNIIAGRVSFAFDLQGPSLAIDTACSSSLVAIHQAIASLRHGECDYALAGGVNLVLRPESFVMLCKGKMLSPTGRCHTFDASADGYVRGEGCGVVLLKLLSAAERDGDDVLAVIRGSAVNQDGRSSSLTAPNGRAQQRVLRAALKDAAMDAGKIGYVEAHGTGTPLGDPIEMHAIAEVYAQDRGDTLRVGSVKTNIGHLEAAAGIAGVVKAALMVKHGYIVPSLHFERLNPKIEIDARKIAVASTGEPWLDAERVAAVSSFGFGGTNAQIILSNHRPAGFARTDEGALPGPFVLSARSEAELIGYAARIAQYLAAEDGELTRICATARASRAQLGDWRLVAAPHSTAELAQMLAATGRGERVTGVKIAHARRHSRTVRLSGRDDARPEGADRSWVEALGLVVADADAQSLIIDRDREVVVGQEDAPGHVPKDRLLSGLYLTGAALDWERIQPQVARVALPTYPFRRERFWPQIAEPAAAPSALPWVTIKSSAHETDYELPLDAQFPAHLRDHQIFGEILVAGATHVALLLSAAAPLAGDGGLTLEDLIFEEPLTVLPQGHRLRVRLRRAAHGYDAEVVSSAGSRFEAAQSQRHLSARVRTLPAARGSEGAELAEPMLPADVQGPPLYAVMDDMGYNLGPSFRWLRAGWRANDATLWHLNPPPEMESAEPYALFPGLIDSCLHAIGEAMKAESDADAEHIDIPFMLRSFQWLRKPDPARSLRCRAWSEESAGQRTGSAVLFEENGDVIARIEGFMARRARRQVLHAPLARAARAHTYVMQPGPPRESRAGRPTKWVFIGDGGAAIAAELRHGGHEVQICAWAEAVRVVAAQRFERVVMFAPRARSVVGESWSELLQSLNAVAREKSADRVDVALLVQAADPVHRGMEAVLLTMRHELPGCSARILRVEGPMDAWPAARIAAELAGDAANGCCVIDGQGARDLQLRPLPLSDHAWRARADHAYLLTGASGALGALLGEWLLERGAGTVVLASRRTGNGASAATPVNDRIERVSVDVGDPSAMAALATRFGRDLPPLDGVFHLAGRQHDALLPAQTVGRFCDALRPKVDGLRNLLAHFGDARFIVCFSSVAAWLGVPGQSAYAAANACMDAFATSSADPRRLLSIAWGPWDQVGMAARQSAAHRDLARERGLHLLRPIEALQLLSRILASDTRGALAVLDMDWKRYAAGAPANLRSALRELAPVTGDSAPADRHRDKWLEAITGAKLRRETEVLRDACFGYVAALVSSVVREASVDCDATLTSIGVDSLMAIEIRRRVAADLGVNVEMTLLFGSASVRSLTAHLCESITQHEPTLPTGSPRGLPRAVVDMEL